MRSPKNILLFLFGLLLIASTGCEEDYFVDLNDADPKIVVDGTVRSGPGPHYVTLTRSSAYFGDNYTAPIEGALVTIIEDGIFTDTLVDEQFGKYYTTKIVGKIGSTYTLRVEFEGEVYEAKSYMAGVADIDSLTYEYIPPGDKDHDEGYYVSIHTQEPDTLGNYNRFMYYVSNDFGTGYFYGWVVSDQFINGNYISFNFDYDYVHEYGDTVVLEMLSISKDHYEFYTALFAQESTGDLFDTPPGNIKGNISNGGFGFFSASASTRDTIIIR